jgi:DNA-binding transcriptional MerR regulator
MKKIKRLARPKTGRKMYSHPVSLTLEQIEWLRQFPNASELVRKMIDSMRELHGEVEPELSLLALKNEIDVLKEQKEKLWEERKEFLGRNFDFRYEKDENGAYTIEVATPKSKYEKGGRPVKPEFLEAQRKVYNQTIAGLEKKLEELKERFTREVNLTNK